MAMCRIVWLSLLAAVVSCPVFTAQSGPDRPSGIVVSEKGAPSLPNKDSALHLPKESFRPEAFIVESEISTLKAVLQDDSKTAWVIPLCASKGSNVSPVGYVRFLLPKNSHVRKVKDIDYQEYLVDFANGTAPLQLWWGGMVSPGRTVEDLIRRSTSFEERSIRSKSDVTVGYDRWGRTADGMVWRAADFPGLNASAIYEGASKEVATSYDLIINSACQFDRAR